MAMLKELCTEQRKGNGGSISCPEFVQRKALVMVQRWGIELSPSTIISDSGSTTRSEFKTEAFDESRKVCPIVHGTGSR